MLPDFGPLVNHPQRPGCCDVENEQQRAALTKAACCLLPARRSKLAPLPVGRTDAKDPPIRHTEKDTHRLPRFSCPAKSLPNYKHETPDKLKFRDRLPNNWLLPFKYVKVKKEKG